MNGLLFAVAAVVWVVAAYAFIRVALAWTGVIRLAPTGHKFAAALDLGSWNFPAVERRAGPAAAPHIKSYKFGFLLFAGAVLGFMILVVLTIVTGTAA